MVSRAGLFWWAGQAFLRQVEVSLTRKPQRGKHMVDKPTDELSSVYLIKYAVSHSIGPGSSCCRSHPNQRCDPRLTESTITCRNLSSTLPLRVPVRITPTDSLHNSILKHAVHDRLIPSRMRSGLISPNLASSCPSQAAGSDSRPSLYLKRSS